MQAFLSWLQARWTLANVPATLNVLFGLVLMSFALTEALNPDTWTGYSDIYDYLKQSQMSLFDSEFYAPERDGIFYPRAFTVPLMFKLSGGYWVNFLALQKCFHFLSFIALGAALLSRLKSFRSRIILIILLHLTASWWNFLGWAFIPVSESLSGSLLLLWLASFLFFFQRKTTWTLVLHLLTMVLFSFTRDNWPYTIVAFSLFYSVASFIWYKPLFKKQLLILGATILVFLMQQHTASIGKRYELPILNNIVLRILPNETHLAWFEEHGMPCIEMLKSEYGAVTERVQVYPLYEDEKYVELKKWVAEDGKSTFMKFLLTHPSKLLMLEEPYEEAKQIFAYNLQYCGSPLGFSSTVDGLFPMFNWIWWLITLMIVGVLSYLDKNKKWIFPYGLSLVFTFSAILLYHADALEVERHLVFTMIVLHLVVIYNVALILDSQTIARLIQKGRSKIGSS